MPEASFALALDMHRKDLPRRAATRHLSPTQTAAFKRCWGVWRKEQKALAGGRERAALAESKA